MGTCRGKIEAKGGGFDVERDTNRLAVLRTGFEYLGAENGMSKKLYVALTVFPNGHAFRESDAAVLPGDGLVATKPMSILERWGVLTADLSGKYRMHDAHVDFAREELMGWDKIRKPTVERWTRHISRLDFAVGVDKYALLNTWRALEQVGGDGWWASRPYDDQLVLMDASNPSPMCATTVVIVPYTYARKFKELAEIMKGAEALFKRALEIQEANLGGDDPGAAVTLLGLGLCARQAGWLGEAEVLSRRALDIQEAKLGGDDPGVAKIRLELGR
ncbi:unnamed protein product [Ectocarpus sp. 12 AP-2014]